MKLEGEQAITLLSNISMKTVAATSDDSVEEPTKLGMAMIAHGIDPRLFWLRGNMEIRKKAGQFLKELGEAVIKETEERESERADQKKLMEGH